MAIDPSIPLQVRPVSIADAANQGLAFGQNMQQQIALTQKTQMDAQEQEQANEIKAARLMHDTSVQLKALPVEQRAAVAQQAIPVLAKLGVDVSKIDTSNLTDDVLDQSINALKPFTVNLDQGMASSRPVGNETIVDRNGTAYAQTRVFDPRTNKVSLLETALGPTSSIANRMGQTAEDHYTTALRLKQQQDAYAAQKALEVAGGKSAIELNQATSMTPILGGQEAIKAASKDQVALEGDIINQGISAAEELPRLEEALDVLQKVNTGGFNKWVKTIADRLGMDTADESLVQSAFSQNIVELLQASKGVQTKADQELIEKTGPNFDLGSKSNIELLKRVISRNKILKKRALDTAKKREEYGTALETLNRDYSYKPESAAPARASKYQIEVLP